MRLAFILFCLILTIFTAGWGISKALWIPFPIENIAPAIILIFWLEICIIREIIKKLCHK